MKVAAIGRGNVGGGLADLWEKAGHEVTRFGREGGDVSSADVLLLAVPGPALAGALESLAGLGGQTTIDATNLLAASPAEGFASNAEFAKSKIGGPTAKSFNLNFAMLLDRIAEERTSPGNIWCGDEGAREVVEQLNQDAGYDPINAGGLENAAMLESSAGLLFAISRGGLAQFFYRMTPPGQL
jgi:8-hydroxy-5-deazaflavin:NADPH oxidoreductase